MGVGGITAVVTCVLLNVQFKDAKLCLVVTGLDNVSARTVADGLEGRKSKLSGQHWHEGNCSLAPRGPTAAEVLATAQRRLLKWRMLMGPGPPPLRWEAG